MEYSSWSFKFFCRFLEFFFQDSLQEQEVIGDWWKMMELGYFSILILSLKKNMRLAQSCGL